MAAWLHSFQDTLYDGGALKVKHPLVRRLTEVQKGVVDALYRFQHSHSRVWDYIFSHDDIPIYYATQFGELDSSFRLSSQILDDDFPLSPKDFQNSVYNAALGCASIIFGFHNPYIALSDGFLSFERVLYLAFQTVNGGVQRSALVIHSDIYGAPDTRRTELLVLHKESTLCGESSSNRISQIELGTKEELMNGCDMMLEEEIGCSWLDLPASVGKRRLAVDRNGEGVLISWS